MSTSRNPLRINVGFILNQPKGTHRDLQLDLPGIELSPDLHSTEILGIVRISRTSEGLLLQGDFRTHIPTTCVRCLDQFAYQLHTEFTDLYAFPNAYGFEHTPEDELDLILPEDGYIDLSPLLREYLLLEIPINPLCRSDCKGLCLQCGANLNQSTCTHGTSPAAISPIPPGS